MDERVGRLRSSKEALSLAKNARRLGRLDVEAEALGRAKELKAEEDGYDTPAKQAIAVALYAYEDQISEGRGRRIPAGRTRQQMALLGPLIAAERSVLKPHPASGFGVLDEAGLKNLSFESIIDRFPEEFSIEAVAAARARLSGLQPPGAHSAAPFKPNAGLQPYNVPLDTPVEFDEEALTFVEGLHNPEARFVSHWLPHYRETVNALADAATRGQLADAFEIIWKTQDNSISNAGRGVLKYEVVEKMRTHFVQVIEDISQDGSPDSFDRIVERFEGWKLQGQLDRVPRLLIARAFSGLHYDKYHTTVNSKDQNEALDWFVEHTGFSVPTSTSWAVRARALTSHLDRAGIFNDVLLRNVFPWFVVEQLRARRGEFDFEHEHAPRAATAIVDLPATRRVIDLRHNVVLEELERQLVAEFGKGNVRKECPTGTGGQADAIARRTDGKLQLYELKIGGPASDVVRQAMGQLLEYAFRDGGLNPAKLVVVGECPIDGTTRRFLSRLRSEFKLNVDYRQIEMPGSLEVANSGAK